MKPFEPQRGQKRFGSSKSDIPVHKTIATAALYKITYCACVTAPTVILFTFFHLFCDKEQQWEGSPE